MKHTKGPWSVRWSEVYAGDLCLFVPSDDVPDNELIGNASLASHAPEMLFAIKNLAEAFDRIPKLPEYAECARVARDLKALIAKVEAAAV